MRTAWLHHRHAPQGRTLIETMVAIAAGLAILGATTASCISVQRLSSAVENYSMEEGSQMLISDYISMDLRRCSAVTLANNVLTITIPDYYGNGGGKPSSNAVPNNPMVVGNNVSYTSTDVTVTYYLQGSSFIRQVNGKNGTTSVTVTANVSNFTITRPDVNTVTCATTFQPRFTTAATANEVAGTKVYTTVYLRNAAAHQ